MLPIIITHFSNMKTQRQLIEESMAEFEKEFPQLLSIIPPEKLAPDVKDCALANEKDKVISHQTKLLIALLDADIQEMEEMKSTMSVDSDKHPREDGLIKGSDFVLTNLIQKKKDLRELLSNEK